MAIGWIFGSLLAHQLGASSLRTAIVGVVLGHSTVAALTIEVNI